MTTDAEHWHRIQAIFHDALEHPEPGRRAFIERECAHDADLIDRVQELVDADAGRVSLLDRGAATMVRAVLEEAEMPRGIGPYRVVRVLGRGGMGIVYLAERDDIGSRAAIKVLRDASLLPHRREQFAAEQRTLAQLNHPSIARLYDANTLSDGTPYLVMEHVEGTPLTMHCRTRDCSIVERLRLFHAVCEAVQYAHRHAVIHRDLKPSNVLVTNDGAVKLLDFGIAKQLESIDRPADQTQGALAMTPAYAAPEQIRGEPVGIHTDIYSLGVILYELLADRLPFDLSDGTPERARALALDRDPPRPSSVVPAAARAARVAGMSGRAAWADLDVLCLAAMHNDPQRRYRTVEALIQDIDRFLAGQPLHARPDELTYRAGKFVRRHRNAVAASATATLVLVVLIAFYTVRLAAARDVALAEAERTARIQQFTLSLFEGDEVGPGDSLRVVTLLDRGVQQARMLDGEPAMQADLFMTLGGIHHKLGNLERADSLLQAALVQRRGLVSSGGDGGTDEAATLVALALLRADEASLDEAERLVRDAIAIHDAGALPSGDPARLRASTALGSVLVSAGRYDDAIGVLEDVIRRFPRDHADTREASEALTLLANAHFYAGRYAVSDTLNRRAIGIDRRLLGDRHPVVADGLINLGAIQASTGNYAEAEALYREALDIFLAYYGPDHPQTASNMTMLSRALIPVNRFDEAAELLERALVVRERVYGSDHPAVASTLNELGNIAIGQDDYDAAETYFLRMEQIYRGVYPDGHYLQGIALANRASAYMYALRYAEAERTFRDAIDVFNSTLPADHLNTGIARIKLGRVLHRQGRNAEAEPHLLAGHGIVSAQTNPSVSWLKSAREDLVAAYEALGQVANAERFRAELAATAVRP